MNDELENILSSIQQKDASVLCREVTSIGDTMDVLRAKWNVEILTAILCGQTRFKDIQEDLRSFRSFFGPVKDCRCLLSSVSQHQMSYRHAKG